MLSGAHDRGANALARRHDRPDECPLLNIACEDFPQRSAEVAKSIGFVSINIFAHATGENHGVVVLWSAEWRGQPKLLKLWRWFFVLRSTEYRTTHKIG